MASVNVIGVAQDELFTVNADVAPPPEPTTSNAGEPQADPASSPLAVRMRPRTLDEVVGQGHLLRAGRAAAPAGRGRRGGVGAALRPARHRQDHASPGCSRARRARHFVALSALSSGVKELRAVIDDARRRRDYHGQQTVLFIDEVHRFSKTQQDALLGAVEDRVVLLVAATTENPSFSVVVAAAVALAGAAAAVAHRGRRPRAAAPRRRRPSAGWPAPCGSPRTPRTRSSGWPRATRAGR